MNEHKQTRYTLLQRACDLNDAQAWEEFVEYYRHFMLYILSELGVAARDIEDVTQQILLALTRDLPGYDPERARFRSWLSTVIRNAAFVYFRKQKNRSKRIHMFGVEQSIAQESQANEIDQLIESEWQTYIANLAMERVRRVFQGRAMEVFELGLDGLSIAEIAEKTGLQVSSVYTLRKRVKKQLFLEIRAIVADLEPQ